MTVEGVAIGTWPVPERTVRVHIPAEVAFDLGRLQESLRHLAERLGHPKCMSGVACVFRDVREFVIDPTDLKARSVEGGVIIDG